jgi:glucoamylase
MKILLKCHTADSSPVFIAGNQPMLGAWDVARALPMQLQADGHDGSAWTASLDLEPGQTIEYKFIKKVHGEVHWEAGSNRMCTAVSGVSSISDSFRT